MTSAASPSPACSQPASGPSSSRSSAGLSDQVPPADELADVRSEIKALTEREKVLRTMMLLDPSARTGNRHIVEIKDISTTRTDWSELRKMYPDLVSEYTFPEIQRRVELREIDEDGVITPIKRKRDEPVSG